MGRSLLHAETASRLQIGLLQTQTVARVGHLLVAELHAAESARHFRACLICKMSARRFIGMLRHQMTDLEKSTVDGSGTRGGLRPTMQNSPSLDSSSRPYPARSPGFLRSL